MKQARYQRAVAYSILGFGPSKIPEKG